MKKRNFLRSLALLVAIVLTVTCTLSNYNFVNAAENDTTIETQESEKELVQCDSEDGKDGWVIFKYTDSNGEPAFDVMYQDKSAIELEKEGFKLQYRILENHNSYVYKNNWSDIDEKISLAISKEFCKIQFRLIDIAQGSESSISDSFDLERKNNSFVYVLYSNDNYYYDLGKKPNHFRLNLKLNSHLNQTNDNLSITVNVDGLGLEKDYINMAENYLLSHPISNISFENHSGSYIYEGKTYSIEYSTISFDVDILPTLNDLDTDYCYCHLINYNFTFNGLIGCDNKSIEMFKLYTETPAFSSDELVNTIQINAPLSSIKPGNSINLTANVLPNTARNKKIDWVSSNNNYATVNKNGTVTTKLAGAGKTVTIVANATDGSGVDAIYNLYIENIPTSTPKNVLVQSIKINAPSTQVKAGKTIDLKASINPDATNKSLVWNSSNTEYATVDKNGVVTTKKAGAGKTVTITAKATDGSGKVATFKLTINKILINKIKLKAKKSIKVGKKLKIKLTISSDATNKAVKWSVNNKKYAKISSKGVLTAKKAGKGKTIKVTAKAKDGSGKKATIKIKIKK